MTPEQRQAARDRLRARIGMRPQFSIGFTVSARERIMSSYVDSLIYGIGFTVIDTSDPQLEIKPVPSFRDFIEGTSK